MLKFYSNKSVLDTALHKVFYVADLAIFLAKLHKNFIKLIGQLTYHDFYQYYLDHSQP